MQLIYTNLILITTLRFLCGEKKIYITIKKSQNVMNMILAPRCTFSNNGACQAKPTRLNIRSSLHLYYPFAISVNKCSEGCNTIDDPYAQISVPDKVKL